MKYFRDVDTGAIVRKPEEGMHLEYTRGDPSHWTKTEPNSAYEREYWLGEGNTCLFEITEEEALAALSFGEAASCRDAEAREREIRKALAGRAAEYRMFSDPDD